MTYLVVCFDHPTEGFFFLDRDKIIIAVKVLSHTERFESRFAKVNSHANPSFVLYISNSKGHADGFMGEFNLFKSLVCTGAGQNPAACGCVINQGN